MITVQPPPRDDVNFRTWMGRLTNDELDAAIKMATDMWTFRRGEDFDRLCVERLTNERKLRDESDVRSARCEELIRLYQRIERGNRQLSKKSKRHE